jgi:hypothetical protein
MRITFQKISFLYLIIFCLSSCTSTNEESSTINEIGSWKLIAILADPGDGSGVFQPVLSDKTTTFETNRTISCTGNLCDLSIGSTLNTSGTYSSNNATIQTTNCNQLQLTYEIEGNTLIINYPFIETCKAKYSRIE